MYILLFIPVAIYKKEQSYRVVFPLTILTEFCSSVYSTRLFRTVSPSTGRSAKLHTYYFCSTDLVLGAGGRKQMQSPPQSER